MSPDTTLAIKGRGDVVAYEEGQSLRRRLNELIAAASRLLSCYLTTDIRISHDIFTRPKIGLELPPIQDVAIFK